ncbi:hypothetical protein [Microbacterium sp. NPDC055665]
MSKKTKKNESGGEGRRPWRDVSTFAGGPGQKWTGVAAPVLIVGLVLVAGFIVFWPQNAPSPSSSTSTESSSAPAASTSSDGAGEGSCPAVEVQKTVVDPPADLEWVSVHGHSWPVSATAGPTKTEADVAQCFDRSPVGAALAAVNAIQSFRTADLDEALRILDARFVPNAGKDKTVEGVTKKYPEQPAASRPWGRVVGYTVMMFTADTARIQLVEDWPGRGQFTGFTVTLQWVDGDWRVELLDSGQPHPDHEPITVDPDAFTRWSEAG